MEGAAWGRRSGPGGLPGGVCGEPPREGRRSFKTLHLDLPRRAALDTRLLPELEAVFGSEADQIGRSRGF